MRVSYKRLAVATLVLLLLGIIALYAIGSLLSAPRPVDIGPSPSDLPIQEIIIPSQSGSALSAWYIPNNKNKGGIILAHGVRANRLDMLERARLFYAEDYAVLLFDFQAHGQSPGDSITFGYLESRDVDAVVLFMQNKLPNQPIAILGTSQGGAATLLSQQAKTVDAIILEAVYPTIKEAVSNRITVRLGKIGGYLTPLLLWQLKPRLGFSADDLRPIDHVKTHNVPTLVIGGDNDTRTPPVETRRLYNALQEPKTLWMVKEAGHQDFYRKAEASYKQQVLGFLEQSMKPKTH